MVVGLAAQDVAAEVVDDGALCVTCGHGADGDVAQAFAQVGYFGSCDVKADPCAGLFGDGGGGAEQGFEGVGKQLMRGTRGADHPLVGTGPEACFGIMQHGAAHVRHSAQQGFERDMAGIFMAPARGDGGEGQPVILGDGDVVKRVDARCGAAKGGDCFEVMHAVSPLLGQQNGR